MRTASVLALLGVLVLPGMLAAQVPSGGLDPSASTWIWSGGDLDAAVQAVPDPAAMTVWHHLGMLAFDGDAGSARAVLAAAGGRVEPRQTFPLHLDRTAPYIGADVVRDAIGTVRDGPTVFIVDTGTDSTHPDFAGSVLAANVVGSSQGALVNVLEPLVVIDPSGHGTHIAGIVAGQANALGALDPLQGKYEGVYSNGRMVSFQAAITTDEDEIAIDSVTALEGFDWALANQAALDIRVVTNSWGEVGPLDPDSAVNRATRELYQAGMTVVFSAGNTGDEPGELNRFCLAPWVLCVAAGDLDGHATAQSSRGLPGDPAYNRPDLTAPGYAVRSTAALLHVDAPEAVDALTGARPTEVLYERRSGTSMAAPHVAAAAGLILAANGDLSPDQVMEILVATTRPMGESQRIAGSGYLDVAQAHTIAQTTPGTLDAFLQGDRKYDGTHTAALDFDAVAAVGGTLPPPPPASDGDLLLWVLLGVLSMLIVAGTVVAIALVRR